MSEYLYFPNNLKDIKDHLGLYDNLQNPPPINGNCFQENLNL